ncbi:MAG: PD40 domain-containing protein [Chloroflexi bacterium]|nr:PD40 domain-containing protein [Chloroflexota bacterium]
MRIRRWLLSLLTACLLVVGVGLGTARAADTASLDEPGTYLVEVGTGRTVLIGHSALVVWSPDSQVAAVADVDNDSPMPRLRLVSLPDNTIREVTLSEPGEINLLRWSPDGTRVALTFARNGPDPGPSLLVADRASATVRQLVRGSIGELAWTPDSTGITAITLDEAGGSIVTFDAVSGEVRETVTDAKDASCQRGLAWSPDGAFLAFGGPGLHEGCGDVGNWGVWSWHPATRTLRQVFHGAADAPQWLGNGDIVAVVSEPQSESIPPLSIVRLSPESGAPSAIVRNVPRMFPQPPRLLQIVGDNLLFPISTCEQGEAYVWAAGGREAGRRTPAGVYAYRPTLAPDGSTLAYVRLGEHNELVVAVVGAAPHVMVSSTVGLQVGTAGPWDAGGDWSPDGKWLAIEVTSEQFRDCVEQAAVERAAAEQELEQPDGTATPTP